MKKILHTEAQIVSALKQVEAVRTAGTSTVFPSARTGNSLQGSLGWFSTALDDAKVIDHTWHCNRHTFASRLVITGLICAGSQSFSGTGHFRRSYATPISLRNGGLRKSIAWSTFRVRTDTRAVGVKTVKIPKHASNLQ
jgi:hypothetical protein